MPGTQVRYLIFDVESVADAQLVARLRYADESPQPAEAVRRSRGVDGEVRLRLRSLYVPGADRRGGGEGERGFLPLGRGLAGRAPLPPARDYRELLARLGAYRRPTLVSFNGRAFDIPLLELAAFRYGLSLPGWFASSGKSFDQPRNRYNVQMHIDLCELLTNFGTTRFQGGLNLAANLLGKPGKMGIQGHMVQDLYDAGRLREINEYCRCDVLDTYFVFLRSRVLLGQLSLDEEQRIIGHTQQWLREKADQVEAYRTYLEHWGDWCNPWVVASEAAPPQKAAEGPAQAQ